MTVRQRIASIAAPVIFSLAVPEAVFAQGVRGAVYQDQTGAALENVIVRLTDGGDFRAEVITDSAGAFTILAPKGGSYFLSAEGFGLHSLETQKVDVPARGLVEVVLRLNADAVRLPGILVVTRRIALSRRDIINERIRFARALGLGRTMTADEIQARNALDMQTLLRTASPHSGRRSCGPPRVFFDGVPTPGEELVLLRPHQVIGLEIYRGASQMRDYVDPAGCGVILVWTNRGDEQPPGRISWIRIAIAAGLIAILVGIY